MVKRGDQQNLFAGEGKGAGEEVVIKLSGSSPPGDGSSDQTKWVCAPLSAFVEWAKSSNANDGKGFSDNSVKTYSAMWGKFVKYAPRRAAFAGADVIEGFLSTLSARERKGYVPRAASNDALAIRRRYLSMLDKLFASLMLQGVRQDNPAQEMLRQLDVVNRAVPRKLPVALSKEDEAALIDVVKSYPVPGSRELRDRAVLALLVGAGLKVSEVVGLRLEDIQVESDPPFVHILGGRVERLAPVSPWALPLLKEWLDRSDASKDQSGLAFPGDDNQPIAACTVYRVAAGAIKKANLNPKHIGPSVLRHTFAVRQLRAGEKLSTVSAWLGHAQETSTAVYKLMVVDPGGARPV